jgi:sorting nexin-9/18/33
MGNSWKAIHMFDRKFGVIKTFIAYQVTPSFSNIQVSRRYKHFDWLHVSNGMEWYGMIITIPPLPEKQVTGRFEEDLIEHRRV